MFLLSQAARLFSVKGHRCYLGAGMEALVGGMAQGKVWWGWEGWAIGRRWDGREGWMGGGRMAASDCRLYVEVMSRAVLVLLLASKKFGKCNSSCVVCVH